MNAKMIVPFHIYEASAGAGKTFLLVQKYLIKLLSNQHDSSFQRMLALTFTNKAVYEMKSRILSQLHFIANEENITADPMRHLSIYVLDRNLCWSASNTC